MIWRPKLFYTVIITWDIKVSEKETDCNQPVCCKKVHGTWFVAYLLHLSWLFCVPIGYFALPTTMKLNFIVSRGQLVLKLWETNFMGIQISSLIAPQTVYKPNY